MATTFDGSDAVLERSNSKYTCVLTDVDDSNPTLTSLTLTLYEERSGTIINNRNAQDILDTNNGSYTSGTGTITMNFQPADNQIINTGDGVEIHVAEFDAQWSGGRKTWRVRIQVRNLDKISS